MRFLGVLALCALLGGCAASKQEVVTKLGDHFIGKNVDALVLQFGPPTSVFKMNSGQGSYVWQLSAVTDIDTYRGSGTASNQDGQLFKGLSEATYRGGSKVRTVRHYREDLITRSVICEAFSNTTHVSYLRNFCGQTPTFTSKQLMVGIWKGSWLTPSR